MDLEARGVCAAALGVLVLVSACDTKDASIGSMDPAKSKSGGSSGNSSIAGDAGAESSQGGTGPADSGGTAGVGRAGALGVGGDGAAMGGGRGGGAGASAGGGRAGGGDAAGGSGASSGVGGAAGAQAIDVGSSTLLAVASTHACVIVGGKVYCWGTNLYGETGAFPSDVMMPQVTLAGLEDEMVGVTGSYNHTCAWARSGSVYCWGAKEGLGIDELPTGPGCYPTSCWSPQRVPGVDSAVEVVASTGKTCARLVDGTLRCWGDQAGDLSAWADGVTDATSLAVAPFGACVTTKAGALSCSYDVPSEVSALQGIRRVALSSPTGDRETFGFGCVLGADDSVTCFGENTHGERGTGELGASAGLTPALTGGVASLSLGADHACALDFGGFIQCWGRNTYGQVAGYPLTSPSCGSETCERAPRPVLGLPRVVTVSAGGQTCALAMDDTVWCWGDFGYTTGAPIRQAGPWEVGGDVCVGYLGNLAGLDFSGDGSCTSDADCVSVPRELSCDHTCAVAPVNRNRLDSVKADLTRIELEFCAPAAASGCASPTVTCSPPTERAICAGGLCTFDAPERTGCTRTCDCVAERVGAWLSQESSGCVGFDLQVYDAACDPCEGGGVNVVVANTGTSDFDGDALITLEDTSDTPTPSPAPRTVTLHLAPGEPSPSFHFDSDATTQLKMRVTAAGDCNPANDELYGAALLGPARACP